MYISLSGLDKAAVLAALYNASNTQNRVGPSTDRMSVEEAQSLLNTGQTGFDYLRGCPMHIDLSGYTLWAAGYDDENSPGAAAKAIEPLLVGGSQTGDGELGRLAQEFSRAAGRLDRRIDSLSSRVSALESKVDGGQPTPAVDHDLAEVAKVVHLLVDRVAILAGEVADIRREFKDHRHKMVTTSTTPIPPTGGE